MFNLPAYLVERMKTFGIGQVHDLGLCTYADERRFFSYRRATHRNEKDYGRLISVIALK
jgi:polyphenol oxidase